MPIESGVTSKLTGIPTGVNPATGEAIAPVVPDGGGVPKLLEGAKLAFVLALRTAFASSFTSENLRYSNDPNTTKLKIFTAHPLTPEFLPCLIVSVASGGCGFQYLNDDYVGEDLVRNEKYYAGRIDFDISVTVMSNYTVERERIIDHLIFFLRHLMLDTIRTFNIVHGRQMRIGSETVTEVENKPVYEQTLSIPCIIEYRATINQQMLETLRRIDAEVNFSTGLEATDNISNQIV